MPSVIKRYFQCLSVRGRIYRTFPLRFTLKKPLGIDILKRETLATMGKVQNISQVPPGKTAHNWHLYFSTHEGTLYIGALKEVCRSSRRPLSDLNTSEPCLPVKRNVLGPSSQASGTRRLSSPSRTLIFVGLRGLPPAIDTPPCSVLRKLACDPTPLPPRHQ